MVAAYVFEKYIQYLPQYVLRAMRILLKPVVRITCSAMSMDGPGQKGPFLKVIRSH